MEGNHHTDSHICNSLLYSFSGLFISMSLGKEQEIAHRTYVKHESEFGNEKERPIYVLFSTKRICVDVLPVSFQEQEGKGNILCLLDTRKTVEVIFLTTCLYTSYNTCFVHLSGHNATGRHITYNERRSIRHFFLSISGTTAEDHRKAPLQARQTSFEITEDSTLLHCART